jgi:replicative DNA helicase
MSQTLDVARRTRTATPGRVPPHNLEAEESLLGAMLLSRDAIAAGTETGLTADEFYKPAHGHIYDAVTDLDRRGQPADPVTVADQLRRNGLLDAIGGPAQLITLQANTPATTNAGRYAHIVRDMALLRGLIGAGGELAELGYSLPADAAAAVDQAEATVFQLGQRQISDTICPVGAVMAKGLERLEQRYESGEAVTGLRTGFVDLDEILVGLQGGDLIVLGARPGVGKTALSLDIARHVAIQQGRPVLFFSLEMNHAQIADRLFAAEGRVDLQRIRTGKLLEQDWPKLSHAISRLGGSELHIDDKRDLTITELRAKARRLRSRLGDLALVIVDYVQLLHSEAGAHAENRQVEIAQITRGLKVLAGELDVPVLALSSLSRSVEMRADKRPMLSDLRESGALEADADVVLLAYRDELYNPASADRGITELAVAKQRQGPAGGHIKLSFLATLAKHASVARV